MIQTIYLRDVLPEVFADDTLAPRPSDVWLQSGLRLERGRRYLVEAESGTGKSSLCSFIYGNRHDYRGQILFDTTDTRTLDTTAWCGLRCRALALLPQEMRLFAELTVAENIALKNGLTDFRSEQEIRRMLEELEVDHKYGQPAGLLSIGQQQRVALVRALCQPFDFLLLDEPVSHLDERNNRAAAAMVQREADAQGAAIVATSVGNHLALTDYTTLHL